MDKKKKKIICRVLILFLLTGIMGAGGVYYYLFAPQFHPKHTVYLYIDRDDTVDSTYHKIQDTTRTGTLLGFRTMARWKDYPARIRTGRYAIRPGENVYHVFSRLYRGYQEPMNLTIGSTRTIDNLARNVGRRLMIDSAEIVRAMHDSMYIAQMGYSKETLPCLFIPDTYQVYWDMSVDDFFSRMQKEHSRFWNKERLAKAEAARMTPEEVCVLASIVEEETNNNMEKPMVAGMYINRLRKGMLLQADPTVKFALQDFGLRRITNTHLQIASPYNTYLNQGLPPGHSHRFPRRNRCRTEPRQAQLPLHVCQGGFFGHA